MSTKKMAMGLIIGNRGFFPDHLAKTGREEMMRAVERAGMDYVVLGPEESKHGAVETHEEAVRCAALFRKNEDRLDGVIVALPNFGDERAIADTLRLARLNVPVLIQATPDATAKMTLPFRRDSFCGKMSACNNLMQYGIPYSLTKLHTVSPDSDDFRKDLAWFAAVCRVKNGLRDLRIGSIGARPAAFNTVRYSEKILESQGISVETVDLSEIMGRIGRLKDDDAPVAAKLDQIKKYVTTTGIPEAALVKMAKLGAVIDGWMKQTAVKVSAVQCWTAMEEFFGVVPCTIMSMMSNDLIPSACEVDICGTVSMHALALASGTPSALLDWNNNYGDDPNKAVCFHCSNLPKHFFQDVRMDFQEIIAGTVGKENTFGTCVGRVKSGPMSYVRFSTDDRAGRVRGYVGEGNFTTDPLETFGGAGVVEIKGLQSLLHYICERGFEHHVAANLSSVADSVHEATTKYMGWDMYRHGN
ncbi:MAG TPA: L-fucose/L-arabinose isomerase family protein [Terriglobales bacterium]|jgi:L-fucose isomerase-like protein|nr:L-fucose/L-arabinose isomerase family protein [Terriglobales bacterium]